MRSSITEHHDVDANGNPAGGQTTGRGFWINWQNGPLAVDGVRREPTGAFVEDIIRAAFGRIECYQATRFACAENAEALLHLRHAAAALEKRTKNREARGVEGTHAV